MSSLAQKMWQRFQESMRQDAPASAPSLEPAKPAVPKTYQRYNVERILTSENQIGHRITDGGGFGLEELVRQEHRGDTSKIAAVYFETESGSIYRITGSKEGVLISDLKGKLNDKSCRVDLNLHPTAPPDCDEIISIGKSFRIGENETTKVTKIEFVTNEKLSDDRVKLLDDLGMLKRSQLPDKYEGKEPLKDSPVRYAEDLHGVALAPHYPLESLFREHRQTLNKENLPAVYFETTSDGRYVVYCVAHGARIVNVRECHKEGNFTPHDLRSLDLVDTSQYSLGLHLGHSFRYAVRDAQGQFSSHETGKVARIVALTNFTTPPEGSEPQDHLIRDLHLAIKFNPEREAAAAKRASAAPPKVIAIRITSEDLLPEPNGKKPQL